jgi:hypothetical protein
MTPEIISRALELPIAPKPNPSQVMIEKLNIKIEVETHEDFNPDRWRDPWNLFNLVRV